MSAGLQLVPDVSIVAQARALVAQARTVDEAKQLRDQAGAIAHFLRERGESEELVCEATEAKLWFERRIGELSEEIPAMPPQISGAMSRTEGSNTVLLPSALIVAPPSPCPAKQEVLKSAGISKMQASRWEKYARTPEPEFEKQAKAKAAKVRRAAAGEKVDPTLGGAVSVKEGYESDEWYTPERFVDAAREVMGGIDLDPASNAKAQETIRARRFFTREDDGLAQAWSGRVWLNPPYSQPLASQFADKLIAEIDRGKVSQAIMIQNASTDVAWFFDLARRCHVCLTRGRINFNRVDGGSAANRYGQVFFYHGDRVKEFRRVFGAFGLVGKLEGRDGASVR